MHETNGLSEYPGGAKAYHESVTHQIEETVDWTTPGLKITRLRLLSDPGFPMWDVSYCNGELDGKPVAVQLPFSQLPKRRVANEIIKYAKADGVYAKGTGILGAISTLN